jgi:hypothetical protein
MTNGHQFLAATVAALGHHFGRRRTGYWQMAVA